jgi:hypothetical protein
MTIKILVANSSEALFFDGEELKTKDLHLLEKFVHPDSRKKNSDLVSDRAGTSSNSGNTTNSYEGHHSPKDIEAENFAKELIASLHNYCSSCGKNSGTRLLVVAPIHFFNLFLKHWHCCCVEMEHLAKDYTKFPIKELSAELRKHLFEK